MAGEVFFVSGGSSRWLACLLGLAWVAGSAGAAESPVAESARQHAAAGLAAAKAYPGLASLCDLSAPLSIPGQGAPRPARDPSAPPGPRPERSPAAPMQVFDNLYFVGTNAVTAWVVKTSEGLILIDALNNDEEARNVIVGGIRKLGLDPAQIKYLLITHAHGDHYGGQKYIVDQFHPRVVMSDIDWKELEKPVLQFSNPNWGGPPKRDMTINNGDKLVLGDTTLTLYVTPGHTPGTVSPVFIVKDKGVVHHAALWGGTGFNFGPDEARLRIYSTSADQFGKVARAAGVDVFLSNHGARDGAFESMAQLAKRQAGEANPFVKGTGALGAITALRECSLAQAERLAASKK